jgi:S-adenosylmethionine synthetase
VSLLVETFGTGKVSESKLATKLSELVDLRPASIIERFELKRPIYRPTASYGHFGRPATGGLFPWEKADLAASLV